MISSTAAGDERLPCVYSVQWLNGNMERGEGTGRETTTGGEKEKERVGRRDRETMRLRRKI